MIGNTQLPALALLVSLPLLPSSVARACGSCGSGGDDPLVLAPNHTWRFYAATARRGAFADVNERGDRISTPGPEYVDVLTLAVGKSLAYDSFLTVTVPLLQNVRDGYHKRGIGDPLVSARWTMVAQNLAEPYLPQVQWIVGHKFSTAPSLREARDPNALDVFGNGFSQSRVGVDLWLGMTDWKGGFAHTLTYSHPTTFSGMTLQPGLQQRTTLVTGYQILQGKVLVGMNREIQGTQTQSGREIEDSERLNHGYFVTADWEFSPLDTVRATWSQRGALFDNLNTTVETALTIAYMRAL